MSLKTFVVDFYENYLLPARSSHHVPGADSRPLELNLVIRCRGITPLGGARPRCYTPGRLVVANAKLRSPERAVKEAQTRCMFVTSVNVISSIFLGSE